MTRVKVISAWDETWDETWDIILYLSKTWVMCAISRHIRGSVSGSGSGSGSSSSSRSSSSSYLTPHDKYILKWIIKLTY